MTGASPGEPPPAPVRRAHRRTNNPKGPRSRLTARLHGEIVDAVRHLGSDPKRAALRSGIPERTWRSWVDRARRAEAKPLQHRTQLERRCLQLMVELDEASAVFASAVEGTLVNVLAQRPEEDWTPSDKLALRRLQVQVAQFIAERRLPEYAPPHRRVELSGPAGGPIEVAPVEETWELVERLRSQHRLGSGAIDVQPLPPGSPNGHS